MEEAVVAKKITQETFDEVVKENMEEFEMKHDEAIFDAYKQFSSQGVDMTDIDISGGVGRQEMLDSIAVLTSHGSLRTENVISESEDNISIVVRSLDTLSYLCSNQHELAKRNLVIMRSNGGLDAIHLLMMPTQNTSILVKTLTHLELLSASSVEIRDFFEPDGSKKLCEIIAYHMDNIEVQSTVSIQIIAAGLSLARCVSKSENNKGQLMRYSMGEIVNKLLSMNRLEDGSAWDEVKKNACYVMRGLSVHDDYRKDMSSAHDNGRFFLGSTNTVASLMQMAKSFRENPVLAAAALSAARNLVTTEEAVLVMCTHGGMGLSSDILGYPKASTALVRAVVGFMRNLCADDMRKENLVFDGSMALMVAAMSEKRFAEDSVLMEHGAACLAAMSLRSPTNSAKIVECGAIEVLVRCMRSHGEKSSMQRQGCLCIRNIAGRCPDLRAILLDAGVESVLRKAGTHRDCVDEAYAALRDLQIEVQFVTVKENGEVSEAFESFGPKKEGEAPKSSFNPIYDEVEDFDERVQNEARAPFALDNLRPFASNALAK